MVNKRNLLVALCIAALCTSTVAAQEAAKYDIRVLGEEMLSRYERVIEVRTGSATPRQGR
jgi:hypothetical protein